jgi:hypothetical protein
MSPQEAKSMKTLLAAAALLVLAVPAALAVPPAGNGNQGGAGTSSSSTAPSASQLCTQQRQTMGARAFRLLYPPPGSAMKNCLGQTSQVVATDAKNAAKACQAERTSLGVEAFDAKYGTNTNKKNAFGKCVSGKEHATSDQQQQATLNAAKLCMAERLSLGVDAFAAKYGTNANKRNAFGKCVSKLASSKPSS